MHPKNPSPKDEKEFEKKFSAEENLEELDDSSSSTSETSSGRDVDEPASGMDEMHPELNEEMNERNPELNEEMKKFDEEKHEELEDNSDDDLLSHEEQFEKLLSPEEKHGELDDTEDDDSDDFTNF